MSARIVFFGTPEFACPALHYLLEDNPVGEVIGVVTQPGRPAGRNLEVQNSRVFEMATGFVTAKGKLARKLPILAPENINDPAVIKQIKNLHPELGVVVAYGQILSPQILSLFPKGLVNIHASLLPRWRGAAPIAWSLLNQDPITGVTLQKVAEKLDSGDILGQIEVVLDQTWDAPLLYSELAKRGPDLLRRFLPDYISGKNKGKPQDEKQVSWAPKIKKEQGLIDWKIGAKKICAQINALNPWPGSWTIRDGKVLKILRAKAIEYDGKNPGEIISVDKTNFVVTCGEKSALMILVVQPESRSRQPSGEYLKGYPFKKGDILGK
jgi:methionyl-tRNA formyltransferase